MAEIDWKAVERGEQKVRRQATGSLVVKASLSPDGRRVALFYEHGGTCFWDVLEASAGFELVPPPKRKHVAWVNLYARGASASHPSKSNADACAMSDRIECRKIEWES